MIRENQRILNQFNILLDVVIMYIALSLAYYIRFFAMPDVEGGFIRLTQYFVFFLFFTPMQLIINYFAGLYDPMRSKRYYQQMVIVVRANTVFICLLVGTLYVTKITDLSRMVFIYFYVIYTFMALLKRYVIHKSLHSLRALSMNLKNVIVVGSGELAQDYIDTINNSKSYGYKFYGYVANALSLDGHYLGSYDSLEKILMQNKTAEVVSALDMEDFGELEKVIVACEKAGTKLSIIPFYYNYITSKPYIDQIDNIPLLNIRRIPLDNFVNASVKRFIDFFGALFLLILYSPVMLIAIIGIKCTSPGPIIFKQKRIGENKKEFTMYKFRSMHVNNSETEGWTTDDDPRKTKFGSFLRKFSIDEMPQFVNVLKGDMSLVGPRPEVPHFVYNFQKSVPLYMVKHHVKPGITGWAQVHGYRGDTSIKKRIEHDVYYIENWSLILDFYILAKTMINGFINSEKIKK